MARSVLLFVLTLAACDDGPQTVVTSRVERPVADAATGDRDTSGPADATGGRDILTTTDTAEDAAANPGDIGPTPSDSLVASDIATDTASDTEPDVPVYPEATPPAPVPPLSSTQLNSVRASFASALAAGLSTATFGGLVVDLENGQTLWEKQPDRVLIPASNSKIFTTAAAIDILGPDWRMLTRVFSTATIDAAGTLNGSLELHSEHDFTLSPWFHNNPRTPLDTLAERLWQRGLRRVNGTIGISGAWLFNGYHLGSYDPATHRTRVATNFRAALVNRGISISGTDQIRVAMAIPAGTELARWESNPLHVAAWPVNRISHNEMSDVLVRHLGYIERGTSDFATGGAVIRDWLQAAGVDVTGFVVNDGSGLATNSRISPRQMVGLYRYMATTDRWSLWKATLSVGGGRGPSATDGTGTAIATTLTAPYNGTLANRMTGDDTAGRVYGKSGTNAGITTSGVLLNRHDGRRYAFAFMMNDISQSAYGSARATQDSLIAVVGRDHRSRGKRPATPTLGCVLGRPDGRMEVNISPQADLTPVNGVAGFRIQTSRDGETWPNPDTSGHFTVTTPVVLGADGIVFVRVFAENAAGRSDPSDVYAVRPPRPNEPRILIVDANDRWQRQPVAENPAAQAHAFVRDWALALPEGFAFDTCPDEAVGSGLGLSAWDAVMWAAGEDAAVDESISAAEATRLADYLGTGGSLFVAGAEISWDLDPAGNANANATELDFLNRWLHTRHDFDSARANAVVGVAGGILSDLTLEKRLSFWTPGQMFVAYPDIISPLAGAKTCLNYVGLNLGACIQYQGDYDVVHLGFPFESIDNAADRGLVMRRVLSFFGL